jgi:hypothetical protein
MLAPLLDISEPGRTRTASAKSRWRSLGRWPVRRGPPLGGRHGAAQHWLALIDIADPARRGGRLQSLRPIEDLACAAASAAESLHRLATVLDALDIDVPVPLWDAASRTPQPSGGYLPDTGVLADLCPIGQARRCRAHHPAGHAHAGADGPEGANILALGDSIRALKRVGLEADARRLGLEALLPVWPRLAAN